VLVLLVWYLSPAQAGGIDPQEQGPPSGGDCYKATDYPTNENQARVKNERGWRVMPYTNKLGISEQIAKGKAEWLLVPDDKLCGAFLGEMKLYGTWYWRPIRKKK